MMDINAVLVLGLASFGLTYLLRYQDGPCDLFRKLRGADGIRYVPVVDYSEKVVSYIEEVPNDGFFGKLMGCHWCLGTWVSAVMTVAVVALMGGSMVVMPFYWLASVGITGVLCDWAQQLAAHGG